VIRFVVFSIGDPLQSERTGYLERRISIPNKITQIVNH